MQRDAARREYSRFPMAGRCVIRLTRRLPRCFTADSVSERKFGIMQLRAVPFIFAFVLLLLALSGSIHLRRRFLPRLPRHRRCPFFGKGRWVMG